MISNEQYASSGSLMDFSGKDIYHLEISFWWLGNILCHLLFLIETMLNLALLCTYPCWYRKCLKNYLIVDQLGNICIFISFVRIWSSIKHPWWLVGLFRMRCFWRCHAKYDSAVLITKLFHRDKQYTNYDGPFSLKRLADTKSNN